MITLDRLLCPVDFSSPAHYAMGYALNLAKEFNATLMLLHVVEPSPAVSFLLPCTGDEQLLMEVPTAQSEARLSALVDEVRSQGIVAESRLAEGLAHREIIELARTWQADMIVIGTHGRTGLTHALMGSTAEKVVMKARCPVLTVRPPGHTFTMP